MTPSFKLKRISFYSGDRYSGDDKLKLVLSTSRVLSRLLTRKRKDLR